MTFQPVTRIWCTLRFSLHALVLFSLLLIPLASVSPPVAIVVAVAAPNPAGPAASTDSVVAATATNLNITKYGPWIAVVGQVVTYTLSAYNWTSTPAEIVVITDTLPDFFVLGGWSSASPFTATVTPGRLLLEAGTFGTWSSRTVYVTGTFSSAITQTTTVTNSVEIGTVTSDDDTTSNSDSTTTSVSPAAADVSISKTGPWTTVVVGQLVTFTISVGNRGNIPAEGVIITDTLPGQFTLGGWWSSNGRSYTESGTLARIILRSTAAIPQSSWSWDTIYVTGTFPSAITQTTTVTNQVEISTTSVETAKPIFRTLATE